MSGAVSDRRRSTSALTMNAAQPWKAELGALLKLAWPLSLAQAGQALMGLVDTAVVGRVSATAQGAVGLGNGLFFFFSVLGMGVMLAFDPLIAQAMGAQDPLRARGLYWQSVWLALLASAVLVVPMALAPLGLRGVGVEPGIADGAAAYVWWRLPQLPALLLFVSARAYLQAIGRPRAMFIATIVANLLNFGLDVLFVFGAGPLPAMGGAGTAVATAIAGWLQFGVLVLALDKAPAGLSRAWVWVDALKALRVGTPIGLQMAAEVGVFALAGVLAARMGEVSVAAHQVAITWASFTFCLAVGVGSAAAVRVGWGIGAGDTPAARRAGLCAFALGAGIMSVSALLFLLWPEVPARVMTDKPEVLAMTVSLFGVTAVFQVFDGVQAVGAAALRGAGDSEFSFWANVVGHYAVGLPIALTLGLWLGQGVVGLWWGLCAGLISVAVALLWRFWKLTARHVAAL